MKKCLRCGNNFSASGKNQKRCEECRVLNHKEKCKDRYYSTYVKKGYNQSRENNNNWKGGIGIYRDLTPKKFCQRCGNPAELVHHKDENRRNNAPENLEDLCKKCHQIEHKCWQALPKGDALKKLKKKQASKASRNHLGQFIKEMHKV